MAINRFTPLKISTKHRLRNRVVVPPMGSATAGLDGTVTIETLKHYSLLTEASAGLLIVEYTYIHPTGRNEEKQLGISEGAHIEGLSILAKLIRESGAMAGIQLCHSGGKSNRVMTNGALMGPSGITVPLRDRELEKPDPMSLKDIQMWKEAFVEGTRRAVLAGFELVEFHAAHGYGLNQMLSPITNKREDEYGRSFEGRTRLLKEIIQEVKRNHPELVISVRIPGQDFIRGGLSANDGLELARLLERLGVHVLNVSSGIGGGKDHPGRGGEGYLVEEAARIQAAVSIPVIGVGGITSGKYIDEALKQGHFALAAVGRALRQDPKAWYEAHLNSKNQKVSAAAKGKTS